MNYLSVYKLSSENKDTRNENKDMEKENKNKDTDKENKNTWKCGQCNQKFIFKDWDCNQCRKKTPYNVCDCGNYNSRKRPQAGYIIGELTLEEFYSLILDPKKSDPEFNRNTKGYSFEEILNYLGIPFTTYPKCPECSNNS